MLLSDGGCTYRSNRLNMSRFVSACIILLMIEEMSALPCWRVSAWRWAKNSNRKALALSIIFLNIRLAFRRFACQLMAGSRL